MTWSSSEMHEMLETLERLTLAVDRLPPGDRRDDFFKELLEMRESLAALMEKPRGIVPTH
jgi:hypothetical protein